MTQTFPDLPDQLREARRALLEREGVGEVGEAAWYAERRMWALPVTASVASVGAGPLGPPLRWYFLISHRYPWGKIEVYPAKAGGLELTYNHQDHNGPGESHEPWRSGDLCLRSPGFHLGRTIGDPDPKGQSLRLLWYLDRLLEWVRRAAAGTLVADGDPFELPEFKGGPITIGFQEDIDTLRVWQQTQFAAGAVELVSCGRHRAWAARRFLAPSEDCLVEPRWGARIKEATDPLIGGWIRLPSMPTVPPFAAPMHWGELRRLMAECEVDDELLLRTALQPARSSEPSLLLIGFPIPRTVGEPVEVMHWQPILLATISRGRQRGFRDTAAAHWQRDNALHFSADKSIAWMTGRNWAPTELATRGQLHPDFRASRVLLLGAGAVGSAVAELLVRGGVTKVVVLDNQSFEAGNLVRHTLGVDAIAEQKSTALADRLNLLSPHAHVHAIVATFPDVSPQDLATIESCDLILDCTGEDDVIQAIAEVGWDRPRRFGSISLGPDARSTYLFLAEGSRFPADEFFTAVAPALAQARKSQEANDLPWEGTGCWHPVFPALATDVWRCAVTAVRALNQAVGNASGWAGLRTFDEDRLSGNPAVE